ncbi:MAG TPA: RsmE family RNA methyltransferase [Acidimicrobiales bacterium]|nr:RsmE family RNA methyltransferase [Acidimicrobiales bacterium]
MRAADPGSSTGGGVELLRLAAALVYVSDLAAPQPDAEDLHHLATVLRLRAGELVIAADGAGNWRGCRVAVPRLAGGDNPRSGGGAPGARGAPGGRGRRAGRQPPAVVLEPETAVVYTARMVPEITVGASLAKGERTEWAVAKLSELGVDRIVPLVCERTVAGAPRAGRLQRIAREAAMQARRVWLPVVADTLIFEEAVRTLAVPAAGGGGGIALAEPGGSPPSLASPVVLVGPEGGWSPAELALGLPQVDLGPTILRIETAAVVAGTLLTALRSSTVHAADPGP